MHGVGLWLASPLYILYYVRQLDASDAWIGLQATVLTATTIVGWLIWRRVSIRWRLGCIRPAESICRPMELASGWGQLKLSRKN